MLLQLWRTSENKKWLLHTKKVVEVISKIAVSVRTEGDIHSLLASILSDKTLVLSMDAGREKQFL